MDFLKTILGGAIGFIILFWMGMLLLTVAYINIPSVLPEMTDLRTWHFLTMSAGVSGSLAGLVVWASKP